MNRGGKAEERKNEGERRSVLRLIISSARPLVGGRIDLRLESSPPADHLSNLEDTVSLDGVDGHALPLARGVELLPERGVLGVVEELRVWCVW